MSIFTSASLRATLPDMNPATRRAVEAQLGNRRTTKRNPAASVGDSTRAVAINIDGLKLASLSNVHTHWRGKAAAAKAQRLTASIHCSCELLPALPAHVTIIRFGPRKLDSDNLHGACKSVRDGIADAYGVDDGSDLYEWDCRQEISKTYAVRIVIQRKAAAP